MTNNLLNDSFFQTPPLRDANLWWLVRLETAIFNAPKTAPSGKKMYLHFHSDQCVNQVFPGLHMQQVGGQYANFSYWRQHETAWDSF